MAAWVRWRFVEAGGGMTLRAAFFVALAADFWRFVTGSVISNLIPRLADFLGFLAALRPLFGSLLFPYTVISAPLRPIEVDVGALHRRRLEHAGLDRCRHPTAERLDGNSSVSGLQRTGRCDRSRVVERRSAGGRLPDQELR